MSGRFKKVSRIGRGTFGEAWLVTSSCSGRRYVIKEVRVDEMSEEELEKTRTEATILARCKHNSIIRYKEYFMLSNPATMCLVMEYADGGDLAGKVKAAKQNGELLSESTILHWFIQVIFAVQYLHANNILHRDLKTQNIFLTKTNLVKVGDFGIARFLRDKQDLATTAIGTPYYLSPEICQRRPYNHKSDMWAVGCILYELCALRHPFDAENFEDLVVKILRGAFRPLPVSFSSLIKDLISVMLRTNPERRPTADALLILSALKPYVESYLSQYEELLSNKISKPSSSDDRLPVKSLPDNKDGSPAVEVDDKLKVCELDKKKAVTEVNICEGNEVNGRYLKRQVSNAIAPQDSVPVVSPKSVPAQEVYPISNGMADRDPLCTPLTDMYKKRVDSHSVSSQTDLHISSPKSPLPFNTPTRKCGSISSPLHPPAPPNTPVNGQFSNTPPNLPIMNISALYPLVPYNSPVDASPPNSISGNSNNYCKSPKHAPTPCNTPTELPVPCNTPSSTHNLINRSLRTISPYSTPTKFSIPFNTPSSTHIPSPSHDSSPISTTAKESLHSHYGNQILGSPLFMESSYNKIYSGKRCRSCGRGFSDTYVIEKMALSDTSADNVFEL